MNTAGAWIESLNAVEPAWRATVRHGSWHLPVLAAAYAGVGLSCVAIGQSARRAGATGTGWLAIGAVLSSLSVMSLFALDQLLLLLARDVARQQGWYETRRVWQAAAIVVLVAAAWVVAAWRKVRLTDGESACRWAACGVGAILAVTALRIVSLHACDAVLQARLAGVSVGRLVELLGLCCVVAGARWQLRARPL